MIESIKISQIESADLEAVKELQPKDWSDILVYMRFYINSSFCKPFKFVLDNKIVGTGAILKHKDSAWLAHIIVHPDYRNRGMGAFITRSLIEGLQSNECKTILLIASVLGEPVYQKLGFKRECDYLFFKNEENTIMPSENKLIKDISPEDFSKVLDLDKKASGEDRSVLLQPYLKSAKIFVENHILSGFYLPELGEGLVMATNETAGVELLKLKLAVKNLVVVPSSNDSVQKFLTENNFHLFQKGTRMSLGTPVSFKGEMIYSRIGGYLG
jgi:N-acetylglutamate synthase-like GNAT family acetyltransferase